MPRRLAVVEDSSDTEELSDNQEIDQQRNVPVSKRSLEYPPEEGDVARRINIAGKPGNTLAMIREAVEFHGKYKQDEKRFKLSFRRAFLKGIEDGVLVRTNATKTKQGLSGRVKLAPAEPKPRQKPRKPAPKKAKDAPVEDPEDEGSSASETPAIPKPPAKPKAPKKVKALVPQVVDDADEGHDAAHVAAVKAPKAKAGRPRKKPTEKKEEGPPPVKTKQTAGKKAPSADFEQEADSKADQEEPAKAAAAKGRPQALRSRRNAL
ncbi:histone H1-I-1, putative [Ixodes scapularis]|uniref:Histone H1-I-1, putative n=1 Tax=Ixodes scapularis TaxID=6945 RepID=B7Q0B9_IXOSC|nr:histone H1-I-1, putative [Ixodes scapularis]|eukprot:XP_002407428.1 histone H1-I-1, putative [Ixodes scapularis]